MTKLYIPLRRDEIEQLMVIAREERRRPADQAAHMLARALAEQENPNRMEVVLT